jgi:hypothetical protein
MDKFIKPLGDIYRGQNLDQVQIGPKGSYVLKKKINNLYLAPTNNKPRNEVKFFNRENLHLASDLLDRHYIPHKKDGLSIYLKPNVKMDIVDNIFKIHNIQTV